MDHPTPWEVGAGCTATLRHPAAALDPFLHPAATRLAATTEGARRMKPDTRSVTTLDLLASRYRHLRRVTASLGGVGEDTAREHVRWLLRPRGEQEEPCER